MHNTTQSSHETIEQRRKLLKDWLSTCCLGTFCAGPELGVYAGLCLADASGVKAGSTAVGVYAGAGAGGGVFTCCFCLTGFGAYEMYKNGSTPSSVFKDLKQIVCFGNQEDEVTGINGTPLLSASN